MKKKTSRISTLQIQCGKAKAGSALSFLGVNMSDFCRKFNEKTKENFGKLINVTIKVFSDGSYWFKEKTPPVIYLLKNRVDDYRSLKKDKEKAREKERKEITKKEVEKIAQIKLPDLNTDDLEKAKKIIIGVAKSAKIKIEN